MCGSKECRGKSLFSQITYFQDLCKQQTAKRTTRLVTANSEQKTIKKKHIKIHQI